jgi:ubiquinone/menaquinone biosynthesis C-methylase UbiE
VHDAHERIGAWWDDDAHMYDDAPGHALSDPLEAACWRRVLERTLSPAPTAVLDAGTGTGSIAFLAAELGHAVTGVDLSEGMLARAREKARERGLDIEFVHGRAETPPDGPFDAVIERHVVWTLPDPVAALKAWRMSCVAGGRLVMLEGSWGGEGPFVSAADAIARALDRVQGRSDHHHAAYPSDLALPLQGVTSPARYLEAVTEAGWTRPRLFRLRDVEWAIARRQPWPLGWLTHRPRYAIVAEASVTASRQPG